MLNYWPLVTLLGLMSMLIIELSLLMVRRLRQMTKFWAVTTNLVPAFLGLLASGLATYSLVHIKGEDTSTAVVSMVVEVLGGALLCVSLVRAYREFNKIGYVKGPGGFKIPTRLLKDYQKSNPPGPYIATKKGLYIQEEYYRVLREELEKLYDHNRLEFHEFEVDFRLNIVFPHSLRVAQNILEDRALSPDIQRDTLPDIPVAPRVTLVEGDEKGVPEPISWYDRLRNGGDL